MPIYEYQCSACKECFEKLVFGSNPEVACPACGSKETEKRLSKFGMGKSASGSSSSGSGCGGCTSSSCAGCNRQTRRTSFVFSYEDQAEALFQNYLDHAEAFVNKSKVKDRRTAEELQPDEAFHKSIEEQIAIIGSAAQGFRQDVIAYLWSSTRRGVKVTYSSYEPLRQAIEKKLMSSVRELSRIVTRATTRDREQSENYEGMVRNLLENGYCPNCVDTVLKYAANNLWKD